MYKIQQKLQRTILLRPSRDKPSLLSVGFVQCFAMFSFFAKITVIVCLHVLLVLSGNLPKILSTILLTACNATAAIAVVNVVDGRRGIANWLFNTGL